MDGEQVEAEVQGQQADAPEAKTPTENAPEHDSGKGFPENTPVAEMTPEQQVAYWKSMSRKHEETAKSNLSKANAELEKLRKAQMSEAEKAIEEAKQAGFREARAQMAQQNVNTFITARIPDKEAADLIKESINHAAFIGEDGTIDDEKLSRYLNRLAPASAVQRDPHQGPRTKSQGLTAAERGRAEAARRYQKTNTNRKESR